MRKKCSIRVVSLFLCFFFLIAAIAQNAFADSSNGESGGSSTNSAINCYYDYLSEYAWRVSLYVAKDIGWDEAMYLSTSLDSEYYFCGSIDITHFNVPNNVLTGMFNKHQYIQNYPLLLENNNGNYYYLSDCPKIPLVSKDYSQVPYRDINAVNQYFLNNKLIMNLLTEIARRRGLASPFDLVKDMEFTNHYTDNSGVAWYQTRTGAEWGENRILPKDSRYNFVPWVIVYEPMALVRLKDKTPLAFLTATEFALTQGTYYNWLWDGTEEKDSVTWANKTIYTGHLVARGMRSLVFQAMPGSVTLKDSWFGYSTHSVSEDAVWDVNEIKAYGGWGMGFLSAAKSLEVTYVDPSCGYRAGDEVVTSFVVKNNSSTGLTAGDSVILHLNATQNGQSIYTADSAPVVVPGEEETYVWFRWTVPADTHGEIRLKVDYTIGDGSDAALESGGVAGSTVLVNAGLYEDGAASSHTPEPDFEYADEHRDFTVESITDYSRSLSWHTWSYNEAVGEYSRCEWKATLSGTAVLKADDSNASTSYNDVTGVWAMCSGYGVYADANYTVRVTVNGGTSGPGGQNPADAVTGAQRASFLFPEFYWSTLNGEYETGESIRTTRSGNTVTGLFELPENPDSRYGRRLHFTPLWFPDGVAIYHVAVQWDACWTPAGTLRAQTVSDGVTIDGSLFDDWYQN